MENTTYNAIEKALEHTKADKETLQLRKDIYKWFEEGGSNLVEQNLKNRIEDLTKTFSSEAKNIRLATQLPKKRRHY